MKYVTLFLAVLDSPLLVKTCHKHRTPLKLGLRHAAFLFNQVEFIVYVIGT